MTEITNPSAIGVKPDGFVSVRRGLACRCPACGEGRLFGRYLKVVETCQACGMPFHHHRADDFPPYIVMFLVGHIVGYGIYGSEMHVEDIPVWLHIAIWPALALVLSLALLQPVKGAVVGLQYGLGMHGFAEAIRSRSDNRATPYMEDTVEPGEGAGADGAHVERQARQALAKPAT
jgi:uncharacterized protein (DUF983 family)